MCVLQAPSPLHLALRPCAALQPLSSRLRAATAPCPQPALPVRQLRWLAVHAALPLHGAGAAPTAVRSTALGRTMSFDSTLDTGTPDELCSSSPSLRSTARWSEWKCVCRFREGCASDCTLSVPTHVCLQRLTSQLLYCAAVTRRRASHPGCGTDGPRRPLCSARSAASSRVLSRSSTICMCATSLQTRTVARCSSWWMIYDALCLRADCHRCSRRISHRDNSHR